MSFRLVSKFDSNSKNFDVQLQFAMTKKLFWALMKRIYFKKCPIFDTCQCVISFSRQFYWLYHTYIYHVKRRLKVIKLNSCEDDIFQAKFTKSIKEQRYREWHDDLIKKEFKSRSGSFSANLQIHDLIWLLDLTSIFIMICFKNQWFYLNLSVKNCSNDNNKLRNRIAK